MSEPASLALHDLVATPGRTIDDAARAAALRLLVSRFSVSPKQLGEPGPSDEELALVALAALRAPDHDKQVPFRFVVIRGEGLEQLAALFIDYGRRRGKSGADLDAERARAVQAPVVLAVVARIDARNDKIPAHEQWIAVGGAISNAMTALHMMGYGAKMVAGSRTTDPRIVERFCRAGETLVGWIPVGTPRVAPTPRGEIDPDVVMSRF